MSIKTIEMIRRIRNGNFEATKNLSDEDQIIFIKNKAKQIHKCFNLSHHPIEKKAKGIQGT